MRVSVISGGVDANPFATMCSAKPALPRVSNAPGITHSTSSVRHDRISALIQRSKAVEVGLDGTGVRSGRSHLSPAFLRVRALLAGLIRVAAYLALLRRRTRWRNGSGPRFPVQALPDRFGCQAAAGRAKIFVPAADGDVRRDQCSSVAQWQSIRLLTGGLLVRVQPEEPNPLESTSYEGIFSGPCLANDFALFLPFYRSGRCVRRLISHLAQRRNRSPSIRQTSERPGLPGGSLVRVRGHSHRTCGLFQ